MQENGVSRLVRIVLPLPDGGHYHTAAFRVGSRRETLVSRSGRLLASRARVSAATIAAVTVLAASALAQTQAAPSQSTWVQPRTPDGQPDLEGIWTNATIVPLQRPAEYAGKAMLTEKEADERVKKTLIQWDRDRRDGGAAQDLARAYGSVWWDADAKIASDRRTALITDPPDGRIPALTAPAQARLAESQARLRRPAESPEDRTYIERCLWWMAVGPPMLPSFANNSPFNTLVSNYEIVQGPGYVVIVNEILHEPRLVPVDGRPHVSSNIRSWLGDSRGHWEGDTLVVDTTNFIDRAQFRGAGANMHLIERFTRTGPDSLTYEFTVIDPTTFAKPWSAMVPMMSSKGPIFEWACHEHNYGLANILSAARAEERANGAAK